MQTHNEHARRFEFYLRELDNHLLVESTDRSVTIRASRDNCSERRKAFFLREINAEGYIPDSCQAHIASSPAQPVRWIIDGSWKKPSPRPRLGSPFMVRLLVYGGVLWLELLTLLFLSAGS
jgi:hypothetical protein